MTRPRKAGQPHKGWKKAAARSRARPGELQAQAEERHALVRKMADGMADLKADTGGYETLLMMYAHIALSVIEREYA